MSRRQRKHRRQRLGEALHRASAQPAVRNIVASTPETKGLHAIAIFEAVKGVAVLAAGFGLLALIHRDVQAVAERFVRALHLNPASRYPHVLIDAAGNLTDARLVGLAAMAVAYAAVRLAEAYGLWHGRAWAEWFAIVSGGLYLPVEIYEMAIHPTLVKATVLAMNVAIVVYLLRARRRVAHEVSVTHATEARP